MEKSEKRYQLRLAAGVYWLLDMAQEGRKYKKPLKLNAMGADIVKMMENGKSIELIIEELCEEYQVEQEILRGDVHSFIRQLKEYGVNIQ